MKGQENYSSGLIVALCLNWWVAKQNLIRNVCGLIVGDIDEVHSNRKIFVVQH